MIFFFLNVCLDSGNHRNSRKKVNSDQEIFYFQNQKNGLSRKRTKKKNKKKNESNSAYMV